MTASTTPPLAIDCEGLTYAFAEGLESALDDVELKLERGDRALLIGANGAGKSTLLRILAGKRLVKTSSCKIYGQDVFTRQSGNVVYLGTEWASNPVVRSDIVVSHFLDSVGGYRHKERRNRLLKILDVDLDWHMHQISDGERRRVQLCMGLMVEWDVLLLDEVTVDLDVLVRSDLIDFLVSESQNRGATIVYATHIFDGLHPFPTKVCHMQVGRTPSPLLPWPPVANAKDSGSPESLFKLALSWLKEDRVIRKEKEARIGRVRGPKTETFFEKYDYSRGK